MARLAITLLILSLTCGALAAQEQQPSRTLSATRISNPPSIDGVLDDDCWETAGQWSGTFVQQKPEEGKPETEETRLKILYDNSNIYVAFRAFDREPARINRWLAPRDQIKGDAVGIIFDSYADKRTGFAFILSAGGTKADCLCSNTDDDDYTWNAVWEGRVSVDTRGWYAEFRIPLSQLRYSAERVQEWGFHAVRELHHKQETDHLHLIPRNNAGLVFSFATLEGISDLPRSRRIELSPYTSAKLTTSPKEAGNPYATGSDWDFGAGLDGKIGLSSDFTLDFTINPDFGQVEADPSSMNLTAFETWYEEKRPFFMEGKNIFSLSMGESMFYSRRIGAAPKWSPDDAEGRYSSVPRQTHIISALKVSGKSRKGLSLGVLNSITSKECADITDNGVEYDKTAQPLTSYSVARIQQDIRGGNTIVGGMLTSTNRAIKDEHLRFLARNAYTGGVDFAQYFLKREYYVRGAMQYSRVEGSTEAITNLQRSAVHNYQREGASYMSVDSSRTRLSGTGGAILIGRGGGKKITMEHRFSWATPGFDLNDIGYLSNADYRLLNGFIAYTENKPTGIFRNYNVDAFYRFTWDCGGTPTMGRAGLEGNADFINKWGMYFGAFYDTHMVENGLLRGGPAVRLNPRGGTDMSFWTDGAKKVSFSGYHGTMFGSQRKAQWSWLQLYSRPVPNLGFSLRGSYDYWHQGLSYATTQDLDGGGKAWLMGEIKQHTLGMTLRVDYSVTPDLSIQFYGNPFMSIGKYSNFKRATDTMNKDYDKRFRTLGSDVLTYDKGKNTYSAHETNGDAYTFDNPDFSFREFRFNLVVRWEYRPNSTLYLVWGQERSGTASDYVGSVTQNVKDLFAYNPTNAFMLKLNYWFSL